MGLSELIYIVIFGLVLFGPEELPKIAKTIGRIVFQVKKEISSVQKDITKVITDEVNKPN